MEEDSAIPYLADSHFHSTAMADRGLDPGSILASLHDAGSGPMLDVAIQPEDSARRRRLTGAVPGTYYSCGLHPGSTGREDWEWAIARVEEQLNAGSFHAVGETGLDWYRMYAPRERQIALFDAHLALADQLNLPVIVHNRSADDDCLSMLNAHTLPAGGVIHCFSSAPEWVRPFLDAGMYISFAGNVTFRNASAIREAAAAVPDDRILIETDAPFLAPHPYRGKDNHPGLLVHTLRVLAEVRGVPPETLAETTATNLARLLQLPV